MFFIPPLVNRWVTAKKYYGHVAACEWKHIELTLIPPSWEQHVFCASDIWKHVIFDMLMKQIAVPFLPSFGLKHYRQNCSDLIDGLFPEFETGVFPTLAERILLLFHPDVLLFIFLRSCSNSLFLLYSSKSYSIQISWITISICFGAIPPNKHFFSFNVSK